MRKQLLQELKLISEEEKKYQSGQGNMISCIGNLMKPIRLVYVWETGRW